MSPLLLALACLPSAAPPEGRDVFGDPLPLGAVARMGTTRLRVGFAQVVAFTPDGKTVIGAFHDADGQSSNLARFHSWDVRTGRLLRTLEVPVPDDVTPMLQIAPDGKTLSIDACTDKGWSIRLFDGPTGKYLGRLHGRDGTGMLCGVSPGGKTALVYESATGRVAIWDVATATKHCRIANVGLVTFLPDGQSFVTQQDGKMRLVRTTDGKNLRDLGDAPPRELPAAQTVTPDGKHAVYRLVDDRAVYVVELATGKVRKWQDEDVAPRYGYLAITADGRTLFGSSGRRHRVVAWDLASGKRVREVLGDVGTRFALSPDGKTIALAGHAAIRLEDVATGKALHEAGHWSMVESLTFSPDGKRLASQAWDGLRVWETSSGKELDRYAPGTGLSLGHLRWHGESLRWIDRDRVFHQWEPGERQPTRRQPREEARAGYAATCPNGEWQVVASDAGIRLNSLVDRKRDRVLVDRLQKSEGPPDVRGVFSPDGRSLALIRREQPSVPLFDVASGQQTGEVTFESKWWPDGVFSSDGRSFMLRGDKSEVYEVATGGLRFRLPGFSASYPLAWTPDGRFVASSDRGRLFVYDVYAEKRSWQGKSVIRNQLLQIALSPDGRRLAVAEETSILVWPLPAAAKVKSPLSNDKAWRNLAHADAAIAFAAVRHFALDPEAALTWFSQELCLPPGPEPKRLAQLIEQLDADDFDERQKASAELATFGPAARDQLREALKDPSLEVRRRATALLEDLRKPSPERLRILRAIETLERIGTPAAIDLLKKLATGKVAADLKAELEASLARLKSTRQPTR